MPIDRRSRIKFVPEVLDDARRRYEDTDEEQTAIAASLGIGRGTLTGLARANGWMLRKPVPDMSAPISGQVNCGCRRHRARIRAIRWLLQAALAGLADVERCSGQNDRARSP